MKALRWIALALAATAISSGVAWANRAAPDHVGPQMHWHGGGGFGHEHHEWHGGGFFGHEHHEWHHHHHGAVIIFGPTLFGPAFDDPFYRYPPPPEMAQVPPTYIERPDNGMEAAAGAPQTGPSNAWYYCEAAGTYYPYIKECPSGWTIVMPQPQQ